MSRELSLEEICSEAVNHALGLVFFSCGIELQVAAVNRLADCEDLVSAELEKAQAAGDEDRANQQFRSFVILNGLALYLRMWTMLKHDKLEDAWDSLVDAQSAIKSASRWTDHPESLHSIYNDMIDAEHILFPYQQFVSPGITFEYALCSVCGEIHGECEHITGMLYCGTACCQIIQNVGHLDHLALVDEPEDKGCRATTLTKDDGSIKCMLTRRIIGQSTDPITKGTFGMSFVGLRPSKRRHISRFDLETLLPKDVADDRIEIKE